MIHLVTICNMDYFIPFHVYPQNFMKLNIAESDFVLYAKMLNYASWLQLTVMNVFKQRWTFRDLNVVPLRIY